MECPAGYSINEQAGNCDGDFGLVLTSVFQEPQLQMNTPGMVFPFTGLIVDPEDTHVSLDGALLLPASFSITIVLRFLDVQENDKLL